MFEKLKHGIPYFLLTPLILYTDADLRSASLFIKNGLRPKKNVLAMAMCSFEHQNMLCSAGKKGVWIGNVRTYKMPTVGGTFHIFPSYPFCFKKRHSPCEL